MLILRGLGGKVMLAGLCLALSLGAGKVCAVESNAVRQVAAAAEEKPRKSFMHKALFYLPNRLFDFVDIFRVRVRVGPGAAVDARMTVYAANFAGGYKSFYVGLPGPRLAPVLPCPFGREELVGLVVMGVEATDDTDYPPNYSVSECNLGAHFLFLGLDLGIDPIEIGDFLAGFFMIDVRGDDL